MLSLKHMQFIFSFLVVISSLGMNTVHATWTLGDYTGIVPYYVDNSQKIYFLLAEYPTQFPHHHPNKLYTNFRGPGSTLDNATKIGIAATKDFFWQSEGDLKKQLEQEKLRIDIRHNYSFYLINVTQQVDTHGGRNAVANLNFGRPVIWIDAEEYHKIAGHSGTHHTFDGKNISHFFFTKHDARLTSFIQNVKLHTALEQLKAKLDALKTVIESLA